MPDESIPNINAADAQVDNYFEYEHAKQISVLSSQVQKQNKGFANFIELCSDILEKNDEPIEELSKLIQSAKNLGLETLADFTANMVKQPDAPVIVEAESSTA